MTMMTLDQWVKNIHQPEVNPVAYQALLPAFVAQAETAAPPVVINSKLVGSRAQSALESDAAYVNARRSGDNQAAGQQLAQSPATGCAMIISLAQSASGYNPSAPSQAGDTQGFLAYLQQLLACPLFSTEINDQVKLNWSADWGTIVDNILGYYKGIADKDLATIRNSLWTIANAAASSSNTNQSENLFVQSTINTDESIKVYIYKSFVLMRRDVHKGSGKNAPTYVENQAHFELYRTVLVFDAAKWPQYATMIMAETDASLSSWLADNSSPKGTVQVNWNC